MGEKKVFIIGGAGQAGRVHTQNLQAIGCDVACFDVVSNPDCDNFFNARESTFSHAVEKGYTTAIVALPDHMLFPQTMKLLDVDGLRAVLIEKPGALRSENLQQLVDKAKSRSIPFFIDYQRSFDPRVTSIANEVASLAKEGYKLDFLSIYSCDKAQPPQAAHQAINQGCHDYAMLLHVLSTLGDEVDSLSTLGVPWGELSDTKFFKIVGKTLGGGIFDVQMCRVSSRGTFTDVYYKMSKFDSESDMYIPVEKTVSFPKENGDNGGSFWDTWDKSFKESVRALMEFDDPSKAESAQPVDVSFGVKVLSFAERVLADLKSTK